MRYSRQRESIYRAVMESAEHPTANMVYERLKGDQPHLSLGTVYRNLSQLSDAGRLMKIPLADGSCRYDGTVHGHSHILCTSCGRVADVMRPTLTSLAADIERETRYRLTNYDIVMYGKCENCRDGKD